MSSFPEQSQSSSGSSGGTLPRSSRGKEEDEDGPPGGAQHAGTLDTPQHAGNLRNGNRKHPRPRPQSLYVSALENCMTGPANLDEGEDVIVAEALISGSHEPGGSLVSTAHT